MTSPIIRSREMVRPHGGFFNGKGLELLLETISYPGFALKIMPAWLFQKSDIFPEALHKLILDEIHNQYYNRLKKNGYDFKMRQAVCDDLNLRYKAYSDIFYGNKDMSNVGEKFVGFLAERTGEEADIKDIMIPLYLVEKSKPKFQEFNRITQ